MENSFYGLGLASNLLLIAMFALRKNNKISTVKQVGKLYLLLAIPAIYTIFLAIQEQADVRYTIFLGIFLAFLALMALFDFVLKVPFRKNWRLLTPYLLLYYAMNYGFVVMAWKTCLIKGMIMLSLFIIQIITNISSHYPRSTGSQKYA